MDSMEVSIVITAQNYAEYLAECIESCLCQTVKCEVIYSDDCSYDDSLAIAYSYPIEVVKHDRHAGVAQARNGGARKAKGKYLLFVDGDDVLPPDYVSRHLAVMDEGVPFVYGAAQCFGNTNRMCNAPEWNDRFLYEQNFCNTSSLLKADVFWSVGGWIETEHHTLWDHHLFLRMQKHGTPRRSTAVLLYRKHGDSNSDKVRQGLRNKAVEQLRRSLATITVGLVYSGRCAGLLPAWMDALTRDLYEVGVISELVIVNNSTKPMPDLSAWQTCFERLRVVPGRTIKNSEDRRTNGMAVSKLLAESCNLIQTLATGDVIHLREDDIITEKGAFATLWNELTSGVPLKAAVAGIYRNRHHARVVGGHFRSRGVQSVEAGGRQPIKVDCTGTGCLLYWRELAPQSFRPSHNGTAAHDWAWGADLKKMGGELLLMPNAICRHYVDEEHYVLPDAYAPINGQNNHTRISR